MLKFFKNLLFPKKKQEDKADITVAIDITDGTIKIVSDRPLEEDEVMEIAKREMKKLLGGEEND